MKLLKNVAGAAFAVLFGTCAVEASATVQSDIDAACDSADGGTVYLPPALEVTATLRLVCGVPSSGIPTDAPVTLVGAPSVITCKTGGTPCLEVGSPTESWTRKNLSVRDVRLIGPPRTTVGSEGIRVLPSADESEFDRIRIEGFQKGMRFVGGSEILYGVRVSNVDISTTWGPVPDVAVHLDGKVANVYFDNFALNAYRHAILSDGPGDTGAGASFVNGRINTTKVPGVASVYVTSSDNVTHDLLLADIQDWETACPYLEIGHQGRVMLNGIAFTGDPQSSGLQPAIKVGTGRLNAVSWLRMNNVNLAQCSGGGNLIEISSVATFTTATGSDLYGPVQFNAAGQGSFTGNRWVSSTCLNGSLSAVRAAANVNCADR